jgi:hypothetical protein
MMPGSDNLADGESVHFLSHWNTETSFQVDRNSFGHLLDFRMLPALLVGLNPGMIPFVILQELSAVRMLLKQQSLSQLN